MRASEGRRPIGIRGKIFASFALFTVLIVFLLWLFQILLLPYFHRAITRSHISAEAEILFRIEGEEELRGAAERIARENNAVLRVYEVEGTVANTLFTIEGTPGTVIPLLSGRQLNELFRAANEVERGAWVRFQLREGDFRYAWEIADGKHYDGEVVDERQVLAVRGTAPDGGSYFLLMDVPFEPITGTVHVLSIQLVVLTAVLLLLSGLLAFLIARRVSRPIARLNEAAHLLPKGRYPADYREGAYLEVAELSDTLSDAAAEIGKVEALQRELIANVSHDLRTPLTMIIGYAEVMRDIEGENTPENMQVIINEATRLSGMVGDLVTISRYQGGAEALEPSELALSEEAAALMEEYAALLRPEGYTFTSEIEEGISVRADRKRILQVIRNLLDNAVNYTGEHREITLALYRREDAVRLEVRDRGPGIPEEELPNIWHRYYRARGNHERSISGSGLGLSIVRESLELHNARYGVESELGVGSTFWFELPSRA